MLTLSVDSLWILLCSALVFLMQVGFLALESGFTRTKNNINVAIKNIADFSISTLLFWAVGFAIMFGTSFRAILGTSTFFHPFAPENMDGIVFFIFQVMFCGTAVTIVSGAVAERMRFGSYLVISAVIAAIIYPVFGHWSWNGIDTGTANGWLNSIGFVDFAGSTVVHSVGGWVALAVLLVIGPREGRYTFGNEQEIPASNLTIATIGVMLLWFGWFGFNGGSALAFNEQAVRALLNTIMAGSAGLVGGMILGTLLTGRAEVGTLLNGTLAGLVGITANAHCVGTVASVIIGFVSVIFMIAAEKVLDRFHIDDAVGAIPVHLAAGVWGTVAVGLLGDLNLIGTGLIRMEQIWVQCLGVVVCGLWTFTVAYLFVFILHRIRPIRVSKDAEHVGLNVSEHNARTDLLDFFEAMDRQASTGDLSIRVPVEPFTEVGRIASRYNFVIESLQQAIERADAIVRTSRDAIVTFSIDTCKIISMNPTAETMFGYRSREVSGRNIALLLEESKDWANVTRLVQSLVSVNYQYEVIGRRSGGHTFPTEFTVTRFEQGESAFYIGTFRDITVRKEADFERQRARELELSVEMANENSRLKSEFLATVSHELRTPLNAMLGYTGLLLMGVNGDIDNEAVAVIRSVEESSRGLLTMINDLLDVDKIESGHMQLDARPLDVRGMAQNWIDHIHVLADEKGIELQYVVADDFPHVIVGDKERLTQIALNLLSNAIKFTDEGVVRLQIAQDGNCWHLAVMDTGIGMKPADLNLIFEKFRQVDGSFSRRFQGTGLGLNIVKQLANLMGGDVFVESEYQRGSVFTVELPLSIPQQT